MGTLFDENEFIQNETVQKTPLVGNLYRRNNGRYADKETIIKEKERIAVNRALYIESCYFSLGKQHSKLLRENEQQKEEIERLKLELDSYQKKIA